MSSKGQQIAILTASLALTVFVIAGLATKDKLVEQYLLWRLDSDDADMRSIAAERLGRLRSIRAIPRLIDNFQRDSAAIHGSGGREKELSAGAKALINVGAPAVPALVNALKHRDKKVKWSSGKVLSWIGPPAVPAVLEALEDQDEDVRSEAARVLALMGSNELLDSEATSVVAVLVEALGDENSDVRSGSAWALGFITPPAKEAVPALTRLLKDVDRMVRAFAEQSLENIKSDKTRVSQHFPSYSR